MGSSLKSFSLEISEAGFAVATYVLFFFFPFLSVHDSAPALAAAATAAVPANYSLRYFVFVPNRVSI